jgi:hypothetical protein
MIGTLWLRRWGERIRQQAIWDAPVTDPLVDDSGSSPFEEQLGAERNEALSNRRLEQIQDSSQRAKKRASAEAKKHSARTERRRLRVERERLVRLLDLVVEQASDFKKPHSRLFLSTAAFAANAGDAALLYVAFLVFNDSKWLAVALTIVLTIVFAVLSWVGGVNEGTPFRHRLGRTATVIGLVGIVAVSVIRGVTLGDPEMLITPSASLKIAIAVAVLHVCMFIAAMYVARLFDEEAPAREAWRQVMAVERDIASFDRRIARLQRIEDTERMRAAELRIEEEFATERHAQERRGVHWFFRRGRAEYRVYLRRARHRPVRSWFGSRPEFAAGREDRHWPRDRRAHTRTEDRH